VAELRSKVTQLEDAGKSGIELAQSQLKRATAELEKSTARIAELEGEISRRDLDALKRQVAEEHNLPLSVAKRLQGSDLRELRADAKSLAEELGAKPGDIGIGRGGTASGNRRGSDMNSLIREAAGRG
jgi:(p)ppGpp synthase/HD superfamily hydrolase